MQEKVKRIIQKYSFMKKPILILSMIYLVGISAILRADFYYIDDIGRAAQGYKQWEQFSRYLSCFLSNFIHADSYLTDVSPLPQMIAVLLLAIAGVIAWYVISGETQITFWGYAAVFSIGLSPYFLECISYKYDAPYMAVSVLSGILPLLFYKNGYGIYAVASFAGTMAICLTYQPATGIFPMLVVLISFKRWNKKENIGEIFKFIIVSALSYLAGLLVFMLFIMKPHNTYVSTSTPPFNQIIPMTVEHYRQYFSLVKNDFKVEWLILLFIMCAVFVCIAVRDSKQKKYIAFLMAGLTLGIMLLLSFGIYPLLAKPLFVPRAMYGFGIFISFVGIFDVTAKKAYLGKIGCLLLSWAFFVFSFTYGNALMVQKTYTDFRISAVIEDLNDLDIFASEEVKTVQISGTIGLSPILRNMPQDYQMLNRLVPVTFAEKWSWGLYGFYNYYDLRNIMQDTSIDLTTYELPILLDTMYHSIRGEGNNILIELK